MIHINYRVRGGGLVHRDFREVEDARLWARRLMGEAPCLAGNYAALSEDGQVLMAVEGVDLWELFPKGY